jgi:hypothetical protein
LAPERNQVTLEEAVKQEAQQEAQMIIKYHEHSEVIEIHSGTHKVCTHKVEDGWKCCCEECYCDAVIQINAAYAYDDSGDHKVMIKTNPSQYHGGSDIALSANVARAFAAALNFAAIDAETLNKEFPA